jgi:hypothetical protein
MMQVSNEPAFPHDEKSAGGEHWYTHSGMTLRDWFAGQALAALISRPITDYPDPSDLPTIEDHVEDAYDYADAMLAARQKGGKQ